MQRRSATPVDKFVLKILWQEQFVSHATEWGISNKSCALQAYQTKQRESGYPDLVVYNFACLVIQLCMSGNPLYPFLGASPDGAIYDLSSPDELRTQIRNTTMHTS